MEEKQEMLVMNKKMRISENPSCCWLDLPHEILESIMKRLFYADLLNFRVVCKSWNSINRGTGTVPLKQSPWLLMFDRIKSTPPAPGTSASTEYCEMVRNWKMTSKACSCKLFDPIYRKTYTIDMSSINTNLFLIGSVYASKHGWILVSSSDHFAIGGLCMLLFAYTPFSTVNNFIELPALESHSIYLATFTSNPSIMDHDCLFVVLHNPSRHTENNYVHKGIIISTCRPGEKSWSSRYLKYSVPVLEFYPYGPYTVSHLERWIYSEGNIYYMVHLGKELGQTFAVKWELVRIVKWELVMKSCSHGNQEEEEKEQHRVLYGSVMNKKWDEVIHGSVMNKKSDEVDDDDDEDDLISKLEKDHFSNLNFSQPLRTAGTEYESCHTERNRIMVMIDAPPY